MSFSPSGDASVAVPVAAPSAAEFPVGHGEMAELIRNRDWSGTPLGPTDHWSPTLRMVVGFVLENRFPLLLWWGPEYISIYNDAYRPVLGTKHPWALGRPVRECWSEIWHVLKPLIDAPFSGGPATWSEDLELEINRSGFLEETHFTVAYSAIPDELAPRGIGGVLATVHEITDTVVGERRLAALHELGLGVLDTSVQQVCAEALRALARYPKDVPFALLYLRDGERAARLAAKCGALDAAMAPAVVVLGGAADHECPWPVAKALDQQAVVRVEGLVRGLSRASMAPAEGLPDTALAIPIRTTSADRPDAALIVAANPHLKLDDKYRDFLDLAAAQIGNLMSGAYAYEDERRRAEALAQIDRAKTLFFSNVSHEFRTPLTLMLGPLEDALAGDDLPRVERARLDVAHRNALRLLKLVNSLLDFARVEAGRTEASYAPADLAAVTRDLAGNFRAACERAGLALRVDCAPLPQPVYVDAAMWEKIVLNVVSNAFKFTLQGSITVALAATDTHARLTVADTGAGIPAHELPHLFERFHRIEGQRGRSFEGSGIGLALVKELVTLHGGTIRADSSEDRGSVFTVEIPFGAGHLPRARIGAIPRLASTAVHARAYVEEALQWLPQTSGGEARALAPARRGANAGGGGKPGAERSRARARARVLFADDNADMRDYVASLLQHACEVRAVADGDAALAALREEKPDLVIADAMMPGLDGFGLLRAIRGDPGWHDLPVIMLSARAGEDSRVQGLEAGADDYLVKPFSARELIARTMVNLESAVARRREQHKIESRRRILEMVAGGAPLERTLDALMLTLEAHEPGMRCGILIVAEDGAHLRRGSGPRLPEAYHRALDGAAVRAPWLGSCCEAVDRRVAIRVPEVAADTRYTPEWRKLLLECGLRACRSTPVRGRDGRALASIGMYYDQPRDPDPADHEVVDMATHLAAIAIEHEAAVASLRTGEEDHAFLLRLSDTLRPLVEPGDIETQACTLVARQLGAERAYFVEINEARGFGRIRKEHLAGEAPSAVGRWPLAAFASLVSQCRQGRPVVVNDMAMLSGVPAPEREKLAAVHIAWIAAPLVKRGELVGALCVAESDSRAWTPRETALVSETAERIWAAAERGLAEQALCEQEQRQALLIHELNHRVKNTLAVVQSLAMQTLRGASGMDQAREALDARLISLSKAHDLLTVEHWQGGDLASTVRSALDTWSGGNGAQRFEMFGESLRLRPKALLALSMAVHELATNAVKYGALSNQSGMVEICWDIAQSTGVFHFSWIERGGPPVQPPTRRGFGSRLIERALAADVGGEVHLEFPTAGLEFSLTAPIKEIAGAASPA
ncbi:MAG: ATP-binding protein [Rhodanobacteraceae bacterium]